MARRCGRLDDFKATAVAASLKSERTRSLIKVDTTLAWQSESKCRYEIFSRNKVMGIFCSILASFYFFDCTQEFVEKLI